MNLSNIRRLGFGLLFGGLLFLITTSSAQAMTVSPVRLEMSGDAGTEVSGYFKVINEETEAKTLYTSFENFEAMGETGSPNFVKGEDGLATWINAPSEIVVSPGETKNVDFSIEVPAGTEPGGYFAAIFLGTNAPSENPNELSIGARIGTLVLFRVNGDIDESAALLDFDTVDQRHWFSSLPVGFYYRFQNGGGDRVMPRGDLTIRNLFGAETAVVNANAVQGNILPRSIRRFEVWWQKGSDQTAVSQKIESKGFFEMAGYQWSNFAFGRYTADLSLAYGSSNEEVNGVVSFFVFPWQLLTVIILSAAIILFILLFGIKRYNRFIITRARR